MSFSGEANSTRVGTFSVSSSVVFPVPGAYSCLVKKNVLDK